MHIESPVGSKKIRPAKGSCRPGAHEAVRSAVRASLIAALGVAAIGPALADDNEDLELGIAALIGTHNFALPFSFSPDPLVGIPAGIVTFATNLGLKDTRAVFVTPEDWSDWPNAAGGCAFEFDLPQSSAEYSNLLGFIDLKTAPGEWGELTRNGQLQVVHANTGVNVHVGNSRVEPNETEPQTITLPSGNHRFDWRAETQISTAFDIMIPAALLTYNSIKYGAAVANQGASAARQAAMQNAARSTVQNIAISTGLVTASQFFDTRTSVTHSRDQQVTIYKSLGPEISTTDPELAFVPVLMLTSRAAPEDTVRGLEAGADDYLAKPFDSAELAARVAGLIASRRSLRNRLGSLQPEETEADSPFMAQVNGLLHQHLADPGFSVRDWAHLMHMDRTTLFRRLKSEVGQSPEQYLRETRLKAAARLLAERAGNVAEVAEAVGFASVTHFSRRFRERFEITPAAYARSGGA